MQLKNFTKLVESIDLARINKTEFKHKSVGCIILTKDLKILLQMRDENSKYFPGCISTFGGGIEANEAPIQTLIRELQEELGATVKETEVVSFGAITDAASNYDELVYVYFWHDVLGTINGCYEGTPLYFNDIKSIKSHSKVMDYVHWLLKKCKHKGLLM